jgi:hypothetical protein
MMLDAGPTVTIALRNNLMMLTQQDGTAIYVQVLTYVFPVQPS